MTTSRVQLSFLIAATLVACSAAERPHARFANAPIVTAVADRADTPRAPSPRGFARDLYHLRGNVIRRLTRLLEVPRPQRALGVNALDEVPSSTWFTNRIGARAVTPDEVRAGASVVGSPEPHRPWTVTSTKVGGASVGFIIRDARGEKYILKFDQAGFPETETAADVITSRLLWAAGYNVPEDHIVHFRAEDLVLAADAKVKDPFGNARPLRRPELERLLATIEVGADGTIRGMASRMLDGTWLGGHPGEGVRADDPNDRIPHELRRDLRGAATVFAWLDHIDAKEDNFLDMWVADPGEPERHYVKHYLIDFGKALGAMAALQRDPRRGHEYTLDWGTALAALASGSLFVRPWEGRTAPDLRGVGMYETTHYDPATWKPNTASYLPFRTADRFDGFWGAKLVMRFTPAQLQAAVEAGQLTDPRATAYLVRLLVTRQRATARHWFSQVAPLDRFAVEGARLCFDDLLLAHRLAPTDATTRYTVEVRGRDGLRVAQPSTSDLGPGPRGRTCTAALALPAGGDGYAVVTVHTRRPGFDGAVDVHLARAPASAAARVIGIWRR